MNTSHRQLLKDVESLHLNSKNGKLSLIKKTKSKVVAKAPTKKLVIKSYMLKGVKIFAYRKYAIREYNNLNKAKKLGINVPTTLELYKSISLNGVHSAVIMEEIDDSITLEEYLKVNSTIEPHIINLIGILLTVLNQTGANHIDLSPENILIKKNSYDVYLIDWQYANFVKPNSKPQLFMQMAQLIKYLSKTQSKDKIREIIQAIEKCLPSSLRYESFCETIIALSEEHLSKSRRFNV